MATVLRSQSPLPFGSSVRGSSVITGAETFKFGAHPRVVCDHKRRNDQVQGSPGAVCDHRRRNVQVRRQPGSSLTTNAETSRFKAHPRVVCDHKRRNDQVRRQPGSSLTTNAETSRFKAHPRSSAITNAETTKFRPYRGSSAITGANSNSHRLQSPVARGSRNHWVHRTLDAATGTVLAASVLAWRHSRVDWPATGKSPSETSFV
jgi:hypothetical protein